MSALLPGGDPLAAALAAGETPSPDAVAASGAHTRLRPAVAVACLTGFLALLAAILALVHTEGFSTFMPLRYPPDVLASKAQDMLHALGQEREPVDTAFGFSWNSDYLDHVRLVLRQRGRWAALRQGDEPGVLFWYRTGRESLRADQFIGGGTAGGRVTPGDPPLTRSAMTRVWLDTSGRLTRLEAVPPEVETPGPSATPPWDQLFEAAGLDRTLFTPSDPTWLPLAFGDARAAWVGHRAGDPAVPLRIEAAAWRGRPVFFRVIGPWTRPERQESRPVETRQRVTELLGATLLIALLLGGALLARHNLALGRGDRRGATRLAGFVMGVVLLAWALEADHVFGFGEILLFVMALGWALLGAGIIWVLYHAIEPYVRRRWAHTIISWSRLLAGRLRDPLVGRDLLVGSLFGAAEAFVTWLDHFTAGLAGPVEPGPIVASLDPLLGTRFIASAFLGFLFSSIFNALGIFVLLFLLRLLLRRDWLAAAAFMLVFVASAMIGRDMPIVSGAYALVGLSLAVVLLLRFGLVASSVGTLVSVALTVGFPLTTDLGQWYASGTIASLIVVSGLALWGFRTSVGGQSLLGIAADEHM